MIWSTVGRDTTTSIRNSVLHGASDLLTPSVVADVVRPTVDQIIFRGRPDVISIGFLLSLWSGSSAMATYVNTITIAYGQRELRSAVRSRLLALRLYIAQVVTGVVLLPALVLGPDLIARMFDAKRHHLVNMLINTLFWPVVALLSLAMLTSLYHLSPPERSRWRGAVPGALLAMALWLVGSYLLRMYLGLVFGNELVYGSLAAPVAALLFFYITAVAVLLGAELNAAMYDNARARSAEDGGGSGGAGGGTTEIPARPASRRWRRRRAARPDRGRSPVSPVPPVSPVDEMPAHPSDRSSQRGQADEAGSGHVDGRSDPETVPMAIARPPLEPAAPPTTHPTRQAATSPPRGGSIRA
jgi:membrane protein